MLTGPNVDWRERLLDRGADRACTCGRHARTPGLAGARLGIPRDGNNAHMHLPSSSSSLLVTGGRRSPPSCDRLLYHLIKATGISITRMLSPTLIAIHIAATRLILPLHCLQLASRAARALPNCSLVERVPDLPRLSRRSRVV